MRNLRQLLSFLAGELAQSHGQRFFAQLCEAMGIYLNARGVLVAEWTGPEEDREARTLALWLDGKHLPQVTYRLAGTPCHEARAGRICVYRKGVKELFRADADVQRLGIQSYVGVPFTGCDEKVIGHLALFDVVPRDFPANELDAIRIASLRAGAEVQRLASERVLAENERRYHSIVNKAVEAILIWHDGKVVDCNDTALRMFDGSRDQILGKTMLELSPPLQSDGTPTAQYVQTVLSAKSAGNPEPFQWRHRRLNGEVFDCELAVQTVSIAEREHLVTLSRDISQRLMSRAALVRSESTLRAALEHSPIPMLVCCGSGEIEMVNLQFTSLFGYSREDVPTLDHWWRLAFPDVQLERSLRCQWYDRLVEAQASGHPTSRPIEANVTCADGSQRFVQIKCVQVGERQLATLLDLTEQHEALQLAEQARRSAETASEAKDQFLAALSHELRTPLTPVLLASSHLQSIETLPAEAQSLVDVIRRNSEMEARLIDDLLDLARISSGKLELHCQAVNVQDVICATLQTCGSDIASRQLQIVQELDARCPFSNADPARLQQVFWNLLKNAVKFTPPGGRISIRAYNRGTPGDVNDNEPPELVVEISDTGVGMTPDVIASLFTAFHQGSREITRQFGGLGLGLSITKQIVRLHGGTIEAFSDGVGKGSRFVVKLTTCPAPEAMVSDAAGPAESATARHARILLVEDHKSTGQLLSRILERYGHEVVWAQSRSQALDVIERVDGFDLLLSDLGLPDGSGLEIMPEFHERTGRPGIALSGYGMDQDLRKTREAGFAMHLIKPVDVGRLRDAVSSLVTRA